MRFEETSLTDYLVKHLQPLTPADPVILAEYVVALLKNDKSTEELQKLCTDNLIEFLGQSTHSFITKLFQDIENGLIVKPGETFDGVRKLEPSRPPIRVENLHVRGSPRQENLSASESTSEPEDKEVTDDDDDDDRNHKHRRREARPTSLEKDTPDQIVRRPNRKGNRPYGNGQLFMANDPLSNDIQKGYNPLVERDLSSKFHDHHASLDSGPRARLSQGYRADSCPRFDLSSSIDRRLVSRGRGRNTVPWNQQDPRFNPLETLDFGSQISSQGHQHPNLFIGTGLPNVASSQNPSWGAFGLIPGMSGGILDPLHPLSLQGTLHPPINPPMSIVVPRQRCRDFEERGFCLRGDICPMEHGVNRIVVEDVQSLSQFNLPVSIPSSRAMGIQPGTGSSSHLMNRALAGKSSKSELTDDDLNKNGLVSAPSGAEAEIYDPDQPLWSNDRHKTSSALLMFSSPNIEDGPLFDGNSLVQHNPEFSDNIQSELSARNFTINIGQSTTSSVWGRIGSSNNSEMPNNKMTSTGDLGKILGDDHDKLKSNAPAPSQVKDAATDGSGIKEITSQSAPRLGKDFGRNHPKASQKALRTLYVNGIPKKCNKRGALLSHFQKFGEVIDIYIPMNSEKAFVQFSKREEAEAALKAPDAVMGNRFIKLWWANRDSVPDDGQTNAYAKSKQHLDALVPLVSFQSIVVESAAQKENGPAAEKSLPVTGSPIVTNVPKALPPVPKKLENLENLKEEIRRKQEMLAQKRDDFRRQLDRLEKQAGTVQRKGELISVQAVKRQKMDNITDVANGVTPMATSLTVSSSQEGENSRRNDMGEIIISPTSAMNSTTMEQSARNIKQMSTEPVCKLDKHPNTFSILPPLPPDLANAAALREHFSSFGDLSSVVLEEPEGYAPDVGLEISSKCSACVTFSTCKSAQRAFLNADCWQGHNLQFKWPAFSSTPGNECDTLKNALSSTYAEALDTRVQAESMTSGTSSDLEKLTCGSIEPAAISTGESTVHSANCPSESVVVFPVETSQSCPAMLPCEKGTSESNV